MKWTKEKVTEFLEEAFEHDDWRYAVQFYYLDVCSLDEFDDFCDNIDEDEYAWDFADDVDYASIYVAKKDGFVNCTLEIAPYIEE